MFVDLSVVVKFYHPGSYSEKQNLQTKKMIPLISGWFRDGLLNNLKLFVKLSNSSDYELLHSIFKI